MVNLIDGLEDKPWPKTKTEREAYMMEAILDGECAIDRLAQMVGTDDFTGLAADAMYAFEQATRDGEPDPGEWDNVRTLAQNALGSSIYGKSENH